jgi:NTE family protein
VVRDVLETALAQPSGRVRVAVAALDRDYRRSLRPQFATGYDVDPDEGVLLPIEGSIAGLVWKSAASRLEIVPIKTQLNLPDRIRSIGAREWACVNL